jgi:hypothetical protein
LTLKYGRHVRNCTNRNDLEGIVEKGTMEDFAASGNGKDHPAEFDGLQRVGRLTPITTQVPSYRFRATNQNRGLGWASGRRQKIL